MFYNYVDRKEENHRVNNNFNAYRNTTRWTDHWKSHQNISILNFERLYLCFDILCMLNYEKLIDARVGQNMSIYRHMKLLLAKDIWSLVEMNDFNFWFHPCFLILSFGCKENKNMNSNSYAYRNTMRWTMINENHTGTCQFWISTDYICVWTYSLCWIMLNWLMPI